MRIWFDTEFIDRVTSVHLLSLGAVREDGLTYYAESLDAPLELAGDWVQKNVIAKFTGPSISSHSIATGFREFCGPAPEFWAYYGTHDWFLILQLYGGFMNLPASWHPLFHDLKTAMLLRQRRNLPIMSSHREHHALDDALWTKMAWEYVMSDDPANV